ncbi:MAG: hypothetical protein PQJ60_09660 [Spirochaetales bacterium]|nr:hypothetical protein [Spirochaetales bacterium]
MKKFIDRLGRNRRLRKIRKRRFARSQGERVRAGGRVYPGMDIYTVEYLESQRLRNM